MDSFTVILNFTVSEHMVGVIELQIPHCPWESSIYKDKIYDPAKHVALTECISGKFLSMIQNKMSSQIIVVVVMVMRGWLD